MGKYWITLVICVQLITQIINFVPTTMASGYTSKNEFIILISSGLRSGQLKVHCKATGTITKKDVEHVFEPGKSFGWDFEVDDEWDTIDNFYSCNFEWNGKKFDFNAWNVNGGYGAACFGADPKMHWAVLEDGFYFRCIEGFGEPHISNWEKRFTWEGDIHLGPSLDNDH